MDLDSLGGPLARRKVRVMLVVGGAPAKSNQHVGTGSAPGTCGELVQGFTSKGQPFHVTCPIEKSSTVSVTLHPAKEFSVHMATPMSKLELSVLRTAEYLRLEPYEIRVAHWTDLDVGRGMGSSTADIVAAARAVAAAMDRSLNSSELASIATSVESSDGSMHAGIVAFDQKSGGLLRRYAWWPQFIVVMVVPAKTLNTESANFDGKLELGPEFDRLLAMLDEASERREAAGFARAATESAMLNQRFVPNPYHALLEDRIDHYGAIGINVGHTGTVVGLLFDAQAPRASKAAAAAAIELQGMFPDARVEMSLTPPCIQ